jgi:hypothetical protein
MRQFCRCAPDDREAAVMDDNPSASSYSYKPSLFGLPSHFELTANGLSWSSGRRAGVIPYGAIERVRISFRPSGLLGRTYLTEIWSSSAPKLTISSQSAKSMVEKTNQAAPYRAFVEALHRRLGAAGSKAQMVGGIAPYLYWPGVAIFFGVVASFFVLILRALQTGTFAGALFISAFLVLFVWQIGGYFRWNHPGIYNADALPPDLLPPL